MVDESLETLACPLAGHAQLRTDGTPRQTGTVRGEGNGFDAGVGLAPCGGGPQLARVVVVGEDVLPGARKDLRNDHSRCRRVDWQRRPVTETMPRERRGDANCGPTGRCSDTGIMTITPEYRRSHARCCYQSSKRGASWCEGQREPPR